MARMAASLQARTIRWVLRVVGTRLRQRLCQRLGALSLFCQDDGVSSVADGVIQARWR